MKKLIIAYIALSIVIIAGCSKDSGIGQGANASGGGSGQGGSLARFTIVKNHLYTIDQQDLSVFDVSNAGTPTYIRKVNIGFNIEALFPYKDKLFIASNNAMYIYNIADPTNPVQESRVQHFTGCDPVVVNDSVAFLTIHGGNTCGSTLNQLDVYDITDVKNPRLTTSLPMTNPFGLGLKDNILGNYILVLPKNTITMSKFSNLVDVMLYFADKETCKKYLARMRWANKPVCPHCDYSKKVYSMKKGNYKCAKCRKPFSVTKGTIFENSSIPLQKWFVGIWLITSHKKGISSLQLHRDLGITQKSSWFMLQRIRHAIKTQSLNISMFNTTEADETYIGGKNKNRHADKKVKNGQGRSSKDKTPVFGLLERGGRVVAMKVDGVGKNILQPVIAKYLVEGAKLVTDEWGAYNGLDSRYDHSVVNHGRGEYVSGACHTNTIEGFWSLLKRGILGTYHNVSVKHLDYYVKEFQYRYNTKDMSCADRFDETLSLSDSRLTYATLISR